MEAYPVLPELYLVVKLLRALLARVIGDLGVLPSDVLLELGPVAGHLAEGANGSSVHVAEVSVHARPIAGGRRKVAVLVRTEDLRGVRRISLVPLPPPPLHFSPRTVVAVFFN